MKVKIVPTMNWKDVKTDTIDPEIYAKIRGISVQKAREIFNSRGFPRLPNTGCLQLADKEAVMMYDKGFNLKTQTKESLEFLILLELRKINERGIEQIC